jgi:hypothetical protein
MPDNRVRPLMPAVLMPAVLMLAACTAAAPTMPPASPAAAAPAIAPLRLMIQPVEARAGGTVTMLLHNRSAETVGYNLCSSALEHHNRTEWVPVPTSDVCTRELRMLPPGAEARYQRQLPDALPAGEYRYLTTIEMQGSGTTERLVSDGFSIVG